MNTNIDKRILSVFIPCTEQESTEVYKLLEQAGLSCSNHKVDKHWESDCDGVETYYDGDFQSYFKSKSEYPELTIKELREIVNKTRFEMNTKHTPEPWRVGKLTVIADTNQGLSINGSYCKQALNYYGGYLIAESITENNASRIVACVNACAGMDDPAKEISTLRARIAELEQPKPTEPEPTTEPTTILGWLERLPDGYRERAIRQCDKPNEPCNSILNAVYGFAFWNDTNEDDSFWNEVTNHYDLGTPLPPLPI
jgi:hypothetical protein